MKRYKSFSYILILIGGTIIWAANGFKGDFEEVVLGHKQKSLRKQHKNFLIGLLLVLIFIVIYALIHE